MLLFLLNLLEPGQATPPPSVTGGVTFADAARPNLEREFIDRQNEVIMSIAVAAIACGVLQ